MAKIIATLIDAIRAYNVSECAQNYKGEFVYTISEDLNVWAGREVVTVAELEEWLNYKHLFSDYHKEAYGTRPRWDYSDYTLSHWREVYQNLEEVCAQNAKEEEERGRIAVEEFKTATRKIMKQGAGNFMTAMRWMMQAEGIRGRSRMEVESFLYDNGILWTEYGQSLFKRLVKKPS